MFDVTYVGTEHCQCYIVEIEVILSCKTVLRLSNQSAASNNFKIQCKNFHASSFSSKKFKAAFSKAVDTSSKQPY